MVSCTAPTAPTLPAPIGLDAEIQRLQLLLAAELSWLQVSYGKAYRGSRKVGNKAVYFPEVYDGGNEYRDVLPNDNVVAQSFFYPAGLCQNPDREPTLGTLGFTQAVDLVVWYNASKIFPQKDYRVEAELANEVSRILNNEGILVKRVFMAPEEVFRGFTLVDEMSQCVRAPYGGFRISLELSFHAYPKC